MEIHIPPREYGAHRRESVPMVMRLNVSKSPLSLLLVFLLVEGLMAPSILVGVAAEKKKTINAYWVSSFDAGNVTIDVELSTDRWKSGETINVTVTISGYWHTMYQRSGGVPGAEITLQGGEASVIAVDPPIKIPEDKSMWDKDYRGEPMKPSEEGSIKPNTLGGAGWTVKWPYVVFYPSGTRFTVTLRLGKRLSDQASILATALHSGRYAFLYFEHADRVEGTVYDVWTNIPQAAHIREAPMSGIKVQVYALPGQTLIGETTTKSDGTYAIESEKLDPKQRYLVRATTKAEGRDLRQERNITGPQRVDLYLPASLVKNYLELMEGLDSVELPSLSDVDLMLGLGFGGPLKEASVYGPLAELAKLGVQIDQSNESLKNRLEAFLDKILEDAPPCRSLLKGETTPEDPWNNLLRLALAMGFVKNRVDDAYISIDNVVKGLTVAVMTTLMMDAMKATANTKLPTVDKLTSKIARGAQEWLLKKGNECVKKMATTIHISIFAGGFGMGGVDWLLTKAGVKDPNTRNLAKTVLAKVIRFGITDLVRKNFGTSLVFEVIFQGARTIGDAALLEFYLWLTRGELENALWAANNSQAINKPLEAVNTISVMDTEHEGWHKNQHSWAVSWFKAANVFRGVGGIWGAWTAQVATPLIKRLSAANPWLKVAGIGSFAGVIITELRALYVTWEQQLNAVYKSFGGQSPFARSQSLGSPADGGHNATQTALLSSAATQPQEYIDLLGKLTDPLNAGDAEAAAALVFQLETAETPLASEMDAMFLRLTAAYPQALLGTEGFNTTYAQAVDAYLRALTEQADLYVSLAFWLRGEETDLGELLTSIQTTSQAVLDAWTALSQAVGSTEGIRIPAFLGLSPAIPERIPINETVQASVIVRNVGDEPVQNAKIALSVDDMLAIKSDPTVILGEIPPAGSVEAKWTLEVGRGQPGDIGTMWFNAEGDSIETQQTSEAILVTLGEAGQLEIVAKSPVQMMVSDSLGRRVGYDPETGDAVVEIPDAEYSGLGTSPQRVLIPDPIGLYQVDLLGTGDGSYHLEIKALHNGQLVGIQTGEGTITQGEWSTTLVPVSQANSTILLPSGQRVEPGQKAEPGEGPSPFPTAVLAVVAVVVAVAVPLALLARKRAAKKVAGTQEKSS